MRLLPASPLSEESQKKSDILITTNNMYHHQLILQLVVFYDHTTILQAISVLLVNTVDFSDAALRGSLDILELDP